MSYVLRTNLSAECVRHLVSEDVGLLALAEPVDHCLVVVLVYRELSKSTLYRIGATRQLGAMACLCYG